MAYIGTQAESPNYFASEPTSIELEGGTYNTDRLYRSSTATVTGDITLSNNLVLARITDKENNVTLTSDGTTRTITGSGKIESGNIVTTNPGNFTGMTGELGSAVTQATGYTLGSGVTFPAGHVVNSWFTKSSRTTSLAITSASGWTSTGATGSVTVTAGNDLFFWYTVEAFGTSARHWASGIKFDGTLIGDSGYGDGIYHGSTTSFSGWVSESNQTKITIASSGTFSVDLVIFSPAGTITIAQDSNNNSGIGYDKITWMALEIQR